MLFNVALEDVILSDLFCSLLVRLLDQATIKSIQTSKSTAPVETLELWPANDKTSQ